MLEQANISVTDFQNYQVLQRNIGGTGRTVTVTGTYTGSGVSDVQARVVRHGTSEEVVAWMTITFSPSGGVFSGPLSVPQGGWYNIQVRLRDASDNVIAGSCGKHKWGVGMIILCAGQSNMVGLGIGTNYTVADDLVSIFDTNANTWAHLADPYDSVITSGISFNPISGGSMVPTLGNELAAQYHIPVAFLPAAKDGSGLHLTNSEDDHWGKRTESDHADTTNLYGNSIAMARAASGIELIMWNQGEHDASNNGKTPTSKSEYMYDFNELVSRYREDLGFTVPFFIFQIGQATIECMTDQSWTDIRSAQHDLDSSTDKIFLGSCEIGLSMNEDILHYSTDAQKINGKRIANAIKYYFGNSDYYRGPQVLSAKYAGSSKKAIDVTISHSGGADFTPSSNITGFTVYNNGNAVGISSVSKINSTNVRINLSTAVTGTGTLRYMYGKYPDTSGMIVDNSALSLPLEPTAADVIIAKNDDHI